LCFWPGAYKACRRWIINILRDSPIFDSLERFIYHKQRNEKPLARRDWITEAIFDFDVQLRGVKDPMNDFRALRG
jgi:hypothetical protein